MKIYTVGGFNEVGKNMTVVDLGDDVIIFDAGLFLPAVVELQEEEMQPENLGHHDAVAEITNTVSDEKPKNQNNVDEAKKLGLIK